MLLDATPATSLLQSFKAMQIPLDFSSLRHMTWNRFLVKMNSCKMPFYGDREDFVF